MYGLVNQALRDLIIHDSSEEHWNQICEKAKISPQPFIPLKSYPDRLTFKLIHSSSELLQIPLRKLLYDLGFYWIRFTADEGYGDLMAIFGGDFITCLKNLNGMHSHMGLMMPNLQPPRFVVQEASPRKIILHYYSIREGLAPMVEGILDGLAKKFHEKIKITHIPKNKNSDHDQFEVNFG